MVDEKIQMSNPPKDETMMLNPKLETLNSKQTQMTKTQSSKLYDLGDRTLRFAKMVRNYIKNLPKTLSNTEDARQLIKASGSVGANYIEAEEALSKKDFVMRIKISRKEAKESGYWLELIESKEEQIIERQNLIREATELTKIFGSIVEKSK
jgi:four helix bundle protein